MCGRFQQLQAKRKAEHEERLLMDRETREQLADRYNLAPTQSALTVHSEDGRWVGTMRRWGMTQSAGALLINSRDDTMAAKPGYFASFRRILVPVDGFYEWPMIGGRKRAFCIRPATPDGLWMFAGLMKIQDGVETFTVMTTASTPDMAELHGRWPVILPPEACGIWLDPAAPRAELLALLRPCPDDAVEAYEVGSAVGDAKNEGPGLIVPVKR